MNRPKGKCVVCSRSIAVKKGVGPYAQGRGDLMWHKLPKSKTWCPGSDEKPTPTKSSLDSKDGGRRA